MVAHGWRLGGRQMRSRGSRFRRSSALAVVGGCLGAYAVFAVGFHWFVEPTLGKNQGVAAYDPSPARIAPTPSSAGAPALRPGRPSLPPAPRPGSRTAPGAAQDAGARGRAARGGVPQAPACAGPPPPMDPPRQDAAAPGAPPPDPPRGPPPPADDDRRDETGAGV